MYFKSTKNPCYFIAEVGSNHEGSFKRAKKLVNKKYNINNMYELNFKLYNSILK